MVLVQKWPVFQLLFLGNIGQESVFDDILERKNAILAKKNRSSISRKIDVFTKGLTHGIGQKMAMFPTFLLRQYSPGKCLLGYSRAKKMPFWAITTRS